jgi:outer membrane usher protein FimD/PapC
MKKIALALLLLPAISFADSVNYANLNLAMLDSDYVSSDAIELSLQSVLEEKLSIYVGFLYAVDGAFDNDEVALLPDVKKLSFAYALDSFSDGSFYLGAGARNVDVAADTDAELSIGYAKFSGNELDYNVSLSNIDGDGESEFEFGLALYGLVGDSGLGWNASLRTGTDVDVTSVGLSFKF